MKRYLLILFVLIISSCGISEDCLKGKSNSVLLSYDVGNFNKIKVYSGVGLVIKEAPEYKVEIKTKENIKKNIEVYLENDLLIIKDNSTCNLFRDFNSTTVYISTPNLEEIHSKTEQKINSDGVLNYPELKLFSMDISDGAGTGDFELQLNSNNISILSNGVSNFYLSGQTINLDLHFPWGSGRFYGENLIVTNLLNVTHRGYNDLMIYPIYLLQGNIYSTGNVILKNNPEIINVNQFYTGRIIFP